MNASWQKRQLWRVMQAGFDTRLSSSVVLARAREGLHNGWNKKDPEDARVVVYILQIGASKPYHDPLANRINDVQELSATREVISLTLFLSGTSSYRTAAHAARP